MIANCTRCGNEKKTIFIFIARPGGHSLPSLSPPDFTAIAPTTERVCGDCISDDEILRELGLAVGFVLGVLMRNIAKDNPQWENIVVSLETARTFFMVRNNESDQSGRSAAVRALGLASGWQLDTQ